MAALCWQSRDSVYHEMINFADLDTMARGGSIALLLLWSWLLIRDHGQALAARLAVGMNATIICYCLASLMWKDHPLTLPAMLVDASSVMAPAAFWLFASVWFSDSKQVGRVRWAAVGIFALIPTAQIASLLLTGKFSFPCWVGARVGMITFAAMGLWIAWQGRDNDLVESRRRFRTALVWLIGCFVMWVNFIEMIPLTDGRGQMLRSLTQIAMLAATYIVSAALYGFANAELFSLAQRPGEVSSKPCTPSPLAERLRAHMTHDRPYRAEGLTIAALAAQLGEQEYRLRRLINGELGFRNFTAFLNSYRLAEVREALCDPEQRPVSILTIALDAGFGSLGPFNRAFREAEGMTPTEFRAKA